MTKSIFSRPRLFAFETIRNKILVFAVLATVIPSGLTAWLSYLENRQALEEKVAQELVSASAQSAREMDVWLKERLYDLRVFASSYEVSENLVPSVKRTPVPSRRKQKTAPGRSPTQGRLKEYLNSVRERFSVYEELLVLDPKGKIVATSANEIRPLDLPPTWTRELSASNAFVGDAVWDAVLGKEILILAVPVQRADGRTLGALAGRLNLSSIEAGLRAFAPPVSGEVYLMTAEGSLIASSSGSAAGRTRLRLSPQVLDRLKNQEGGLVELESFWGRDVVGSFKQVPKTRWAVLAEIPADVAYLQIQRFRDLALLIMAGLLIGVSLVAYRMGALLVRPLERLIKGATEVAEGDLAVDLPAAKGEVGELTSVFNHMVARLRKSRREVEAMNERLRKQNEELELLSTSDALTGLHNRRFLTQRLSEELSRSFRQKCVFTVLMADVDEFKKYNDAFGHPAGDEVLKKVADILLGSTRAVDCTARYGGEEFAVLLTDTTGHAALEIAERIRARVAEQEFPGRKITISIGVAEFPQHGRTAEAVVSSADEALYEAKRKGRNRVVLADAKPERQEKV